MTALQLIVPIVKIGKVNLISDVVSDNVRMLPRVCLYDRYQKRSSGTAK